MSRECQDKRGIRWKQGGNQEVREPKRTILGSKD